MYALKSATASFPTWRCATTLDCLSLLPASPQPIVIVDPLKERRYDRIHVGACCPTARLQSLIDLLKPGGILVTPNEDALLKITKSSDGQSHIDKLTGARYGGT